MGGANMHWLQPQVLQQKNWLSNPDSKQDNWHQYHKEQAFGALFLTLTGFCDGDFSLFFCNDVFSQNFFLGSSSTTETHKIRLSSQIIPHN